MSLILQEGQLIKEFLMEHQKEIEKNLLAEAGSVREKIEEIQLIGNINLIDNAHKLIGYVVEQQTEDLVKFAEQEGVVWAKHAMTLMLKLDWVHAIRRTLWSFLSKYDQVENSTDFQKDFYILEKTINEQIDKFLNVFFISYSTYKDKLLEAERKLVENLSVQIIPISANTAIFPLIGTIDPYRSEAIRDKVLAEVGKGGIHTLIIDLSGVADMEGEVTHQLLKVIDGISLMGCKAVITGTRAEIASKMVNEGLSFRDKAKVRGNLEQAIKDVLN
ncbi:STAS domain-containing protein [Pseudalkalibacillus berkeleyi]|uniref:STAS domain-containing protein n=1 Tax=Pseudalkalibacillus berkeleyi TaxID=1069813 RepID=A0ABS9H4M7_9BACL|nr:STAS domain-containing protein [Pseudalkalibacillus berkeleyi]MCF6138915.1 STAS domain-containing protein [Pseudalkalibacillus berkeleyi]